MTTRSDDVTTVPTNSPVNAAGPHPSIAGVTAVHRQAVATASAVEAFLSRPSPPPPSPEAPRELCDRLTAIAADLAPNWLGRDLANASEDGEFGDQPHARRLRIGVARPGIGLSFPLLVPLAGEGHLVSDRDGRDSRVAGLLQSILLRLLAASPAKTLLVHPVDGHGGAVFAPFASLADTGLLAPPVTELAGLRSTLSDLERWTAPVAGRPPQRNHLILLVVAALPAGANHDDLTRIAALADRGPELGLHLVVAGWPTTAPGLPRSTAISLDDDGARVGNPPGALFGLSALPTPGSAASRPAGRAGALVGGLTAPAQLDPAPPAALVARLCAALAGRQAATAAPRLADLLPERRWHGDATDGLTVTVGVDGDRALELRLNDATPHWMISGRPGGGKTAFLLNVLHGLCARYSPGELALYLVDLTPGGAAAELAPTDARWLPHARVLGIDADREFAVAVLRELTAETRRREQTCRVAGVERFHQLRGADAPRSPRVLCVIDEHPQLLAAEDALAQEARTLIEELARQGRQQGIHLILAGAGLRGAESLASTRDPIGGQFPVRIALPGGGDILDPSNDAAASLGLGAAVVNTAGGFGGPRGATRGHERTIRFPDPYASRSALVAWRDEWFAARRPETTPPTVFFGGEAPRLADDPTYRAALAGTVTRPAVLLGHTVDLPRATAAFAMDATAGSHVAIVGSGVDGARLLDVAARSLAIPSRPTRFVLCEEEIESVAVADNLAAALTRAGQEVTRVESADLAGAAARDCYLVVFGMDALVDTGRIPGDTLRDLLRNGPERGVRLLSWWRSGRRLADALGARGRDSLGCLVFLDVAGIDVAALTGQPLDWRHRPGRVLLYDRRTDRTSLVAPFAAGEDIG
ncbi:FtsK/SpoIIIE domain-containing protein [Pilimelia columellifera]|uniref:FtsK/SpoIIIE domain-containing protein n=1 Tax=Pilimelia columellifera subsp. columellifera TaxID=706583 RepID=A0ABN3ND02_9ACTN